MEIIELLSADDKKYWLNELDKQEWVASKFLASLIRDNEIYDALGQNALVFMLVDETNLVSFCTLANYDEINPTDYHPWIGFVYTSPLYRGNHYAGKVLEYAESIAAAMRREYTYISTDHIGLYEKYGYEFLEYGVTINDEESRIYRKSLANSN